jgi:hypothetical protein
MKKQCFIIFLLSGLVLLMVFAACSSKEKADKKPLVIKDISRKAASDPIWNKMKLLTTTGLVLEISNPEIDYSEYSKSGDTKAEDKESFGIRIRKKDETETIPWEMIKHLDISAKGKSVIHAKINLADGKNIEADLAPDTGAGLSGSVRSKLKPFEIRLKDIKTIDVQH